tara:strand:+ start:102 stop:1697 length:1596 start_codon:yes stop_codon:yes gene_type:complete
MRSLFSYQEAERVLSTAEKVGQLFMPAAFINDTEVEIQQLETLIREQQVGGICFFHSRISAATNFEGKKEVPYNAQSFDILKKRIQRFQKAAKYPLLIAIDAEWGLAMRIENTPQYPYAITLGAMQGYNDLIFEVGRQIAMDCKAAGIHWNLAPVVDINNNPDNPVIGYRSFGEDRDRVTEKALAYIRGTQREGILTSIKHFPGHGDTATDSHIGLPLIDKSKAELLQHELYPFQELINEGVDAVMVGHLSVPALADGSLLSSSISKKMINGVLRGEMGFKGVVISDALNMHAVSKNYPVKGDLEWLAFDAGNDVLCFAENTVEGISTILQKSNEARINESFKRVWQLKERALPHATTVSGAKLSDPDPLNHKLAMESITLLKGTAHDLEEFKNNSFLGLCISRPVENVFFKAIGQQHVFTTIDSDGISVTALEEQPEVPDRILLCLLPRQVKPTDNFGFTAGELALVNNLINSKNVVLYLFGNPFILKHINIENAKAVIVAYQHLEAFQKVAAEHFLGNFKAKGKLPVTI